MREILFRGKRVDNGEWVEGAFCQYDCPEPFDAAEEMPSIIKYGEPCSLFWFEVDPKTVSQYTGLKDRNGRRIFEGDIVDILTENEEIGVVEYDEGGFLVSADGFCVDFHSNINGIDLVVIGNIHDTPELLEGGAAE